MTDHLAGTPSEADVFALLCDIANEVLAVDPSTMTMETNLVEDLDADSLQLLEMLSVLENRFPQLPPLGEDGLPELVTVADVVAFVREAFASTAATQHE